MPRTKNRRFRKSSRSRNNRSMYSPRKWRTKRRCGTRGRSHRGRCGACGRSHRGKCGNASNEPAEKQKWFYIIDMQNDFIDAKVEGLSGPGNTGAFAVAGSGEKLFLDSMAKFIKKQAKKTNTHFVVSRDYHPINHCSFNGETKWENIGYTYSTSVLEDIRSNTGVYPPHCIQGTIGSLMNSTIKDALDDAIKNLSEEEIATRFHVAFKGWHSQADSYGCHPYKNDEDTKTRLGEKVNVEHTGGVKLNNKTFTQALKFGEKKHDILNDKSKDDNKTTKFTGPPKEAEIYVFGLAGNFCVQDTATNLKQDNFQNVTVLNNYTMYADDSDILKDSLLKPHSFPIQFSAEDNTRKDTKSYIEYHGVNLKPDINDDTPVEATPSAKLQSERSTGRHSCSSKKKKRVMTAAVTAAMAAGVLWLVLKKKKTIKRRENQGGKRSHWLKNASIYQYHQ